MLLIVVSCSGKLHSVSLQLRGQAANSRAPSWRRLLLITPPLLTDLSQPHTLMRSHCRPFMCLTTRYSIVWREIGGVRLRVRSGCQVPLYVLSCQTLQVSRQVAVTVRDSYAWLCLRFSVSVGYEYESCPGVIQWERRTALMQGFELVPSNLGGWSLDKHHALNIRSGESTQCTCFC